jgi:hypothetical protein
MPAGYSKLIYPRQPEPEYPMSPDNCYYMINLHQAQAFFPAAPLVRPAFLTLSSTIESPFQPGQPLKSLYQAVTFQKNQPFRLPISVNLSTFLPARSNDSLRLTLRYIVTRDNPFQKLAGKMKDVNLVAKISAVNLEWGVAIKVSEITANLLSYVLQEGGEDTVFELYQDINIADLKAGYWIVYGSRENPVEPGLIEIYNNELRADSYMEKFCYAILKVVTIPSLKDEAVRTRPWWELLQAGKDKALSGIKGNTRQRDAALFEWGAILVHVKEMARKDQSYLLKEIEQIIGKAQKEIDVKVHSGVNLEAYGNNVYPETWQEVLNVRNTQELSASLRDYQDALDVTERLLTVYKNMGI